MGFFSIRPRRTRRGTSRHSLVRWRGSVTMAYLLSVAFLFTVLPVLPALAATHPQPKHPIDLQTLRQHLKRNIHVTHTGPHPRTATAPRLSAKTLPAYNNVAISDDQNPVAGNFDTQGNSYSAQALSNLGLLPGLSVTTNDITYSWPNVASGSAENYQAAGQVLPVPPISDAASVGFLGASTNGNTSGTATLTFTDSSTQTFTLGLTDWTLGATPRSAIPSSRRPCPRIIPASVSTSCLFSSLRRNRRSRQAKRCRVSPCRRRSRVVNFMSSPSV